MRLLPAIKARSIAVFVLALSGCVILHSTENDYVLLNPGDAWVKLASPPPSSDEMISGANYPNLRHSMLDKDAVVTWFARGDSDYLVYIKSRREIDSYSTCGDEIAEFKRSDGNWIQGDLNRAEICAD